MHRTPPSPGLSRAARLRGGAFAAAGDALALGALTVFLLLLSPLLLLLGLLRPLLPARATAPARLPLVWAAYLTGFSLTALAGSLRLRARRAGPDAWRLLGVRAGRRFRLLTEGWTGLRFQVDPPEPLPDPGRPVVVLARHAGILNTQLAITAVTAVLGRGPRGIAKRCVALEPGLRALLRGVPLVLFRWNRAGRAAALAELTDQARNLGPGEALWLYPEGTNYSAARRAASIARLRARGQDALADRAAAMPHLLPPHLPGALAVLSAVDPSALVLVCGHTGPERLLPWMLGPGYTPGPGDLVRLRWWSFRADQVPTEQQQFADWLYDRWQQLDTWIAGPATAPAAPPHPAGDLDPA
ncbi:MULTISPECIES: 1-acyl-sn-glycerol-3-phosphate acyltransferase [Kitasatospora]|uniref:Putative acyltransferase n=1 Tax=Kitasatospora setae (strain ATCC 33774 / DSM 43861 / JCM 3304 / KCC A-0304 / NBRC 14216 / KM-6054) TaxID=452652 RepID=E4N4K4_KITSK|nr:MULTISPECIES: 1-acyl-sn-glycerol-3-phosphate acyltransferase [Kitasatospora]BAJ26135.1 putative acyltransferase [Kitasatospora setae KM-6054]